MQISKEQAKWILQSYAPIRGHGRVDKHKAVILETLSIMRGQPVTISCNCELGALSRITNNMFEQYQSEIEALAAELVIENERKNEGPKAKGRPKRQV